MWPDNCEQNLGGSYIVLILGFPNEKLFLSVANLTQTNNFISTALTVLVRRLSLKIHDRVFLGRFMLLNITYKTPGSHLLYLIAILKKFTEPVTIFGCLLSKPFRISSWTASCFSISRYIIQISIPFCFVLGRALRHFVTTPATTSPAALHWNTRYRKFILVTSVYKLFSTTT